jgi:hypothetical protein
MPSIQIEEEEDEVEERDEERDIQSKKGKIKPSYVIELKGDFYSLNYFAFYLDSDDEDLCEI